MLQKKRNLLDIIEIIRDILSFKSEDKIYDKDIAKELSMSSGNLATCKSRDNIPYSELVEFCINKDINLHDILIENSTNYKKYLA